MIARNAAAPAERRIEFRMGINVGDIIIEDGDIFGDGVNIAARLEALAEPGGICMGIIYRDREPRSPLRAYWSVYELTHRAPSSRRAAGSRSTRTECPESVGTLSLPVGAHSGTASH